MAAISVLAKYKLVFLGDQAVGKSSIITRFMYDKFDSSYQPTIGIDFLSKTMYLEDRTVRLQLWMTATIILLGNMSVNLQFSSARDTAGQERFRSLIPSYIRDCSVAIIVYDISNRQSFMNIQKWVEEVNSQGRRDIVIALVGSKNDLVEKRQVSLEEGEAKAKEFGAIFVETSAKSGFNIKGLFRKVASALPGVVSYSATQQEEFININLRSSVSSSTPTDQQQSSSSSSSTSRGCAC